MPLLLLAYQHLLAPRFKLAQAPPRESDVTDESSPVIVAGCGRFGHIIMRLLRHQGFGVTAIDLDPDQVDLFRKIGIKVFYGDASRVDLLHAAGAHHARLLVIAVNEPAKILEIAQAAREHFPHLKILLRAEGRQHAYELMAAGFHDFERETLGSSLDLAERALRELGVRAHAAHRAAELFRQHDEKTMRELAPLWEDEQAYFVAVRQHLDILNQVLTEDRQDLSPLHDRAWDNESRRRQG